MPTPFKHLYSLIFEYLIIVVIFMHLRWREKVFALMVQQKSTAIVSKKDEHNWKTKVVIPDLVSFFSQIFRRKL